MGFFFSFFGAQLFALCELFLFGGTGAGEEDFEFFGADDAFEMSFSEFVLAEDFF